MSFNLSKLNKTQRNAVMSDSQYNCVIAGAGSGKTRVLTYRFGYLVYEKKVSPQDILCVTFTNRAADEMKERIHNWFHINTDTVMTLNSLGNKILQKEIYRIGWWEGYDILATKADQVKKLKKIIDRIGKNSLMSSISEMMAFISQQKSKLDYMKYLVLGAENDLEEQLINAYGVVDELREKLEKLGAEALSKDEKTALTKAVADIVYYSYLVVYPLSRTI